MATRLKGREARELLNTRASLYGYDTAGRGQFQGLADLLVRDRGQRPALDEPLAVLATPDP
jgi:hypothetical protein